MSMGYYTCILAGRLYCIVTVIMQRIAKKSKKPLYYKTGPYIDIMQQCINKYNVIKVINMCLIKVCSIHKYISVDKNKASPRGLDCAQTRGFVIFIATAWPTLAECQKENCALHIAYDCYNT